MDFCVKLQELRKRKGITQEELAKALYVSRTAVSKWESGRGYPSIESLKALAEYFGVSVDELLSGEELLSVAEENTLTVRSLVFGLTDICFALFFFLPLFGQETNGSIQAVSLIAVSGLEYYLKTAYFIIVTAIVICGVFSLTLQNCKIKFLWKTSLILNILAVLLFIISLQPYAAVLTFVFLAVKVLIIIKKQ